MNVRLSLDLPRESASVPMARRILAATLGTVGVTDECRSDILLALAEACANAVTHALPADGYRVCVEIDDVRCLIDVTDAGAGFEGPMEDLERDPELPLLDESGRGLHIIRALADHFDLGRNDPTGTRVRFTKHLQRPAHDA